MYVEKEFYKDFYYYNYKLDITPLTETIIH